MHFSDRPLNFCNPSKIKIRVIKLGCFRNSVYFFTSAYSECYTELPKIPRKYSIRKSMSQNAAEFPAFLFARN
jgi:hypothetical protein